MSLLASRIFSCDIIIHDMYTCTEQINGFRINKPPVPTIQFRELTVLLDSSIKMDVTKTDFEVDSMAGNKVK
jgi:hypothetical protein